MKKTFILDSDGKDRGRHIEKIRHEIKKYIARERRKELKDGADFWDFDCKIGETPETAVPFGIEDITSKITAHVGADAKSFYLEILSKPGKKTKKAKS